MPTRWSQAPIRWADGSDRQGRRRVYVRAVAADGVTVDDERVRQQLGAGAVLVGAFGAVQPMANERAVAVLETRLAFATFHAAVLAPIADRSAMPRRLVAG